MSDYAKISRNTVKLYMLTLLVLPLGFIIRALYARKLSIVDYGLFFGLFAFFGLLSIIRDWGLSSASTFYVNKYLVREDHSRVKTIFFLNQGFQVATSLVIFIILFILKKVISLYVFKNEGHIDFLFGVFAIYWVLETILATNLSFLNIFQEQHISKAFDMVSKVIILFFSLIAFNMLSAYKVPVYAYLSGIFFIACVTTYYIHSRYNKIFKTKMYVGKDLFSEYFSYATLAALGSVILLVFVYTDTFLVQVFLGAEQVGYYNSGFSIAEIMMIITGPLFVILQPFFTRIWHEKKKDELARISTFFLNHLFLIILPVAFFFMMYADRIVFFVLGANFGPAVIILQLFCIVEIIKAYSGFTSQILIGMGKVGALNKISLISGSINVIGNIILLNLIGTIGAVITTITALIVFTILTFVEIKREVKLSFDTPVFLKSLVAAGVFALIVYLLKPAISVFHVGARNWNYFLDGLIVFIIAFIVYCGILVGLRIVTKQKIIFLKRLLKFKVKAIDRLLGDIS